MCPSDFSHRGVDIEEIPRRPIPGVATSIAAFVDFFRRGPTNEPAQISSFAEFEASFGGLDTHSEASYAIQQFFLNGGNQAWIVRVAASDGSPSLNAVDLVGGPPTGIFALDGVDLFNILCLPCVGRTSGANTFPADQVSTVLNAATSYCRSRRAFFIVDAPSDVTSVTELTQWLAALETPRDPNAALYFPRIVCPDPLDDLRPRSFGASGTIAGLFARIDAERGVWKAPAGVEATLRNVARLEYELTDAENGELNPLGINALRTFPSGTVCWGARTLAGSDQQASDWKYIPVRRLALFLEESIDRGTEWAAPEPNDERLWAQIRLHVGAFMQDLFRRGAFQGATQDQAYFVKCDTETTSQTDIDNGVVNIVVGFAPLKPAEFVIVRIQQLIG